MEYLLLFFFILYFIGKIQNKKIKIYKGSKKKKKSINVIDAKSEMEGVINYLSSHYVEYCTYQEILNIKEEDRLSLMQTIWQNWNYRNTEQKIYKKYPQYSKDDLYFICIKEMARVYTYYHWQKHLRDFPEQEYLVKIYLYDDWRTRFCDVNDEINIFNTWNEEEEFINNSLKICSGMELQTEYIYFYQDGEYIKMSPKEFKQFCRKKGYEYPFYK